MPIPNIFVSHRWDMKNDYYGLVAKLDFYGLKHLDYSVPRHDPLDVATSRLIAAALDEQVRQCNYFIIFANQGIGTSKWCMFELQAARKYHKPVLSVKPYDYQGGVPLEIAAADSQGGPVGFHGPSIIRKVCQHLGHPVPLGL